MTVRELIVKLKAAAELVGDEAEVRIVADDGSGEPLGGPFHVIRVKLGPDEVVDLQPAPWRRR